MQQSPENKQQRLTLAALNAKPIGAASLNGTVNAAADSNNSNAEAQQNQTNNLRKLLIERLQQNRQA
jgi:hypothetical protein